MTLGKALRWTDRWKLLRRQYRRDYRIFRQFPAGSYRKVLDIGAHRGEFAAASRRFLGSEKIWLVEPQPGPAERLRQQFRPEDGFAVIEAAVSDRSGTAEFHVHEQRGSSSLLAIDPAAREVYGLDPDESAVIRVPCLSLDELFEKHGVGTVDLMKVDIQGAEHLLLRGGSRALEQIRAIYIEVNFQSVYEKGATFTEVHAPLAEKGFKLAFLDDFRRGQDGALAYANAFYWKPGAG
jgi:FkbM family methyltransferase